MPAPAYHLHSHVVFTSDSTGTIDYHPRELVEFKVGYDSYESHDIGLIEPNMVFLKVMVLERVVCYEYSYPQGHHALPEPAYLLRKTAEHSFYQFDFRALKKGTDDYFSDNSMLIPI